MKRKITKIRLILEQEATPKQEYVSAAGQARYQDGNEKTSIAAARRKALAALKAKGAKGKIQFHKPKKVGDKYVVVAYVGTPEKGEWDASQGGYSPTGAAAEKGKKILDKVKHKYPDNEYVENIENYFGTPEKWHAFLTGAKALDEAPKAQQEYSRLNKEMYGAMNRLQRAKAQNDRSSASEAFKEWKELKKQFVNLKLAAGLASKVGYRVSLFGRDKGGRPGEEERNVYKSTKDALRKKTKIAKLPGTIRKGRGFNIRSCRINKRCKCMVPRLRHDDWKRDPRAKKERNSDEWNRRLKDVKKMLAVVIPKEAHEKGFERYACSDLLMRMIAKFQKSYGLKCDGCLGRKSYPLLKKRYDEIMNA